MAYDFKYYGHKGDVSNPREFYSENDYVICRGAIPADLVDKAFGYYNEHIANSPRTYLRQSTQWEKSVLTKAGGVCNTFLNPHMYRKQKEDATFGKIVLDVLSFDGIHKALSQLSGIKKFTLFQSMLFDQVTTRAHQDWIYLDSKPNGHVIAAWVALEDTKPEGIRFFVYPGSHHFKPQAKYGSAEMYADLLKETDEELARGGYEMYAPALKKGDVFFWGSRVIHGSIEGTDNTLRRRSIAAHFVPHGMRAGNLEMEFKLKYKKTNGLKYNYQNLDKQRKNIEKNS